MERFVYLVVRVLGAVFRWDTDRQAIIVSRTLCSRPFLALHVLQGRPLMCFLPFEIHLAKPLEVGANTRIVGCKFSG